MSSTGSEKACMVEGCDREGRLQVRGTASTSDGTLVDVEGRVCNEHKQIISLPLRSRSLVLLSPRVRWGS